MRVHEHRYIHVRGKIRSQHILLREKVERFLNKVKFDPGSICTNSYSRIVRELKTFHRLCKSAFGSMELMLKNGEPTPQEKEFTEEFSIRTQQEFVFQLEEVKNAIKKSLLFSDKEKELIERAYILISANFFVRNPFHSQRKIKDEDFGPL